MFGKLKNGYFIDTTSGLAFKLNLVIVGQGSWGSDLGKIHDEVNRLNGIIKNDAQQCLVTLGFLQKSWEAAKATNPQMAEMIAGKTRCFIYLPQQQGEKYLQEYKIPYGFPEMSFIWNASNDRVYTPYTTNNLGWRYESIPELQVTEHTPTPTLTPSGDTLPVIHTCPKCGQKLSW
jgi:hypothetical protein